MSISEVKFNRLLNSLEALIVGIITCKIFTISLCRLFPGYVFDLSYLPLRGCRQVSGKFEGLWKQTLRVKLISRM